MRFLSWSVLILLFNYFQGIQSQYRIGFTDPTLYQNINITSLTNGTISITFVNISLPLSDTIADLQNALNITRGYNLSAIVSDFQTAGSTALLNNYIGLPYYVIGNTEDSPINSYMLSMSIGQTALAQVTSRLLSQFSISSISIIKDDYVSLAVLTAWLPQIPTYISVALGVNAKDTVSPVINESPNHCYLLVMREDNFITYIPDILEAAMYMGQLRSGKRWIIHSMYYNLALIASYSSTGASIYTMNMNITNYEIAHQYLAQDSVKHFYLAVTSKKSFRQQIATGLTGNIEFDPSTGYRRNVTISILQTSLAGIVTAGTAVYRPGNVTLDLAAERESLTNKTIRVAHFLMDPYFSNSSTESYGMGVEIVKILAKNQSFSYYFVPVTVRQRATIQDDMLDLLVNDKADFCIMPIENTPSRSLLVDFSVDVMSSSTSALAVLPRVSLSYTWLAQPYTYNVWIAIGLAFFLLSFVFWASDKISPNKAEGFHGYSFSHSCLVVFSSPFMAKLETKPMKPSARIFAILLWFGSLMLMATYISNMAAFCVKPDPDLPFDSFDTLLEQSETADYKFFFVKNETGTRKVLASTKATKLYNVSMMEYPDKMFVDSYNDVIPRMKSDSSFVFIGNTQFMGYATYQDCSFGLVMVQEQKYSSAIAINKKFKAKEALKTLIDYFVKSQEFARQQRVWYESGNCAQSNTAYQRITVRPLDVDILAGLFVSLAIAIGIACIIACIEYSHAKLVLMWRLKDVKHLEFGKVYAAKIEEVEYDGVWVRVSDRPRSYFLHNCHLNNDPMRIFTAEDLHLRAGDIIQVKYFGKDPSSRAKRFMRDESDV